MSQENQISDSWDDIDESELEERLEKEKQERLKKEQEMASTANQNGISLLSNGSSDEFRPRILQRPSPKVTILKRPPDSSNSASSNSQNVNKTQIESLEQREKEYAEARLRILGSATESTVSEDQVQTRSNTQKSTQYSYFPPSVNQTHAIQQQENYQDDNVVRLPRGPNGQGFNIRR